MTKLDQIRLAIYEKCEAGEITDEEKKVLLESAVEKYSESEPLTDIEEAAVDSIVEGILTFTEAMEVINSDEEEEVEEGALEDLKKLVKKDPKKEAAFLKARKENEMFVESFDKLKDKYDECYDKAKDNMKNKDVMTAMVNLGSAKVILEKMKSLIQHTPSTLENSAMSHISTGLESLIARSIVAVFANAVGALITKTHFNSNEVKKLALLSAGFDTAVNITKTIRTKEPNLFKADALLLINKEIININNLENKLRKVKAKIEKEKSKKN